MLRSHSKTAAKRAGFCRDCVAVALLCATTGVAVAAIDPDAAAPSWWDASRAERIDYSNAVAAALTCKPIACSSSDIRYCLNDTLKPPVPTSARHLSLAKATAACIEQLKARK